MHACAGVWDQGDQERIRPWLDVEAAVSMRSAADSVDGISRREYQDPAALRLLAAAATERPAGRRVLVHSVRTPHGQGRSNTAWGRSCAPACLAASHRRVNALLPSLPPSRLPVRSHPGTHPHPKAHSLAHLRAVWVAVLLIVAPGNLIRQSLQGHAGFRRSPTLHGTVRKGVHKGGSRAEGGMHRGGEVVVGGGARLQLWRAKRRLGGPPPRHDWAGRGGWARMGGAGGCSISGIEHQSTTHVAPRAPLGQTQRRPFTAPPPDITPTERTRLCGVHHMLSTSCHVQTDT